MDIISKYTFLKEMGSSYTWETLDDMPYVDYVYVMKCMEYQNKAVEFNSRSKGGQKIVS